MTKMNGSEADLVTKSGRDLVRLASILSSPDGNMVWRVLGYLLTRARNPEADIAARRQAALQVVLCYWLASAAKNMGVSDRVLLERSFNSRLNYLQHVGLLDNRLAVLSKRDPGTEFIGDEWQGVELVRNCLLPHESHYSLMQALQKLGRKSLRQSVSDDKDLRRTPVTNSYEGDQERAQGMQTKGSLAGFLGKDVSPSVNEEEA